MKLPLPLDMEPMLSAISDSGVPKGDGWEYEPKWDGFRTLVYRDGEEVELMSRGGRPMTRYFPELVPAVRGLAQKKLVLDGEVIVVGANAKSWDGPYLPGKRLWVKIKHQRTADCVVVGWRRTSDGSTLGALLLGLYDKKGTIHYVGHTSSFSAAERKELIKKLKPLETKIPEEEWRANPGRMPGGLSRWSRGKDTEWVAVRPELVCEVTYDKLEAGERFRQIGRASCRERV